MKTRIAQNEPNALLQSRRLPVPPCIACSSAHQTSSGGFADRGDRGRIFPGRPGSRPGRAGSKSNSSRAGPFAGPKPEPMTVPRGATRSNRRAHPSRLRWARGFLPSWLCEFDSRHPL
jgi:hypothetical protein